MGCVEDPIWGECEPGRIYCEGDIALTCLDDAFSYRQTDCRREGLICNPGLGCVMCRPGTFTCEGNWLARCRADGMGGDPIQECEIEEGDVCHEGRCMNACKAAEEERSYMGCEYWPVDLDNATISQAQSAAAQQYAVAVSNVGFIKARVAVYINTAPVGWPVEEELVSETVLAPDELHVFLLPPREVDGSHSGLFDNGTHTHLSSNAYRLVSNVPIVAYQFNPLENVQVFSNDASVLIPTSALGNRYMALSWPQTIAKTDDPDTNFNRHLRTFLTVVGTKPGTNVSVTLSTDIVGSPDIPAAKKGETIHAILGPYDVLNLETGGFNADFTGSTVVADEPVAVYTGSEASDVPYFEDLSKRICCADHLEHQQFPESAAGTNFVAARVPRRTPAVAAAGGDVSIVEEPEYFRILALYDDTVIQTTLPPPHDILMLDRGEHYTMNPPCDFEAKATKPIFIGQFISGQGATGIAPDLPGGDPSFIMLSPVEQWRSRYVFLTPDKYAFDFFMVIAPAGTDLSFNHGPMPPSCQVQRAECSGNPDPTTIMDVWRCQLSFPKIIPGLPPPDNIDPGDQNDGYHLVEGDKPFMLVVYGFDKHVSYAYIGGKDVRRINIVD